MLSLDQSVSGQRDGLSVNNLYVHMVSSDITGQRSPCPLTHTHRHNHLHTQKCISTCLPGQTGSPIIATGDVIELMRKWPQRSLMSSASLALSPQFLSSSFFHFVLLSSISLWFSVVIDNSGGSLANMN